MSAAQFDCDPLDPQPETEAHAAASALKLQAAERLAAHRARRGRLAEPQLPGLELAQDQPAESRATRIAAAVAERYAHSQSYRAFLAAEAERAVQQAEAAAEIAARTAKAVAASQQQLLSELADWTPPAEAGSTESSKSLTADTAPPPSAASPSTAPINSSITSGLTVRLYEDVGRSSGTGVPNAMPLEPLNDEERFALDEEIAFRQSPGFEEFLEPASPLPANLIEFPRQLIASRKARPRLAEGPLREEADMVQGNAQLRIFEVDPDQISTEVALEPESTLPEWSSIRLDASPATQTVVLREDVASYSNSPDTAPLDLRVMSAIVDGCLVLTSFLGFVTVFACTAGKLPSGQAAIFGAVGTLAALAISYQLLFFTFSDATPGMRYARISLCTFSDDNPTRSAMRRRIIAVLLAACPMGLGFLWAWLDDDRLGWHDRISGMYQRNY